MTNKLKSLLSLIIITLFVSLTSCGSDDPEPAPAPTPEPEETVTLVGTWHQAEDDISMTITLNANHTGSATLTGSARASITLRETFNWNNVDDASANHWLEIIHSGGDEIFGTASISYILAGSSLTLSGWGNFSKM